MQNILHLFKSAQCIKLNLFTVAVKVRELFSPGSIKREKLNTVTKIQSIQRCIKTEKYLSSPD